MTPSTEELRKIAVEMRQRAYAPYSKYHVGAAVQFADGRIVGGCNIENASYGLSCCAERTAVFRGIAEGAPAEIRAVAVATEEGGSPCGACRQVLVEFAPKDGTAVPVLLLDRDGIIVRETTLTELLPFAFTLEN
jgi:homotetrameric cytidine deaminase